MAKARARKKASKNNSNSNNGYTSSARRLPQAMQQLQITPAYSGGDTTARRFLSCIANPFAAAPSRGISNGGNFIQTALVRRRNVCTVTLSPGTNGVDIFIPQGTSVDPFVYTAVAATANWATTTVNNFNFDPSITIPTSATGRIVASGVRITCCESATNAAGVFYHYWTPHGVAGGNTNAAPALTHGAAATGAAEAISIAPVQPGKTITFINPSGANWVSIADASTGTALNTNFTNATLQTAKAWPDVQGTRLYFDAGSAVSNMKFLFEIVSVVEYYHDSHRNFAEPSVTHSDGERITMQANAMLTQRASNNSMVENHGSHTSLTQKLHKLAEGAEAAERFVVGAGRAAMRAGQLVYNIVEGSKAIRNAAGASRALALAL